jgi:methionyl-tRNA synthetase
MTNPASNSAHFYLTTPIYYVNARPHLGHAYSTIVCDAIARRKRALGIETWFLTGTDEHGQKIERSAKQAGRTPQEFATAIAGEFRALWDRLGITYDDFIRTTEPRHKLGVQKLFATLRDRGYIYKGSYTGQYCVSDEAWVDVAPGAPCPDCGRITETVSEENYFFKLSAFERKLLEFYDANPDFMQPESTRREVISFVRSGLADVSISRTALKWGIPVPGDEEHVIYVWLDALANYITALGYGSEDAQDQERFAKFWPANMHLIGKEISRFHCVYWPAFLMAAGIPCRFPCAPTAGSSSIKARCRNRAATLCEPKPCRKFSAPTPCAISSCAKFPSARMAIFPSTHWSSATTATSPTATATSSAASSTWCTNTSAALCRKPAKQLQLKSSCARWPNKPSQNSLQNSTISIFLKH